MPLRKFRYLADDTPDAPVLPRVAEDHDAFVASPVHAMHDDLWDFAEAVPDFGASPEIALYPGWVRLTLPIAASAGLWLMIFWMFSKLR